MLECCVNGIIISMIIEVNSEADMKALGARLGAAVRGGEVIELIGDVGAGKTTLTKGLAVGIGVDEDVQSPSFTISRVYEAGRGLQLVHYDFYRLQDPGILMNELAENQSDSGTVTVIEWADIVDDILPADRLQINILATAEDSRQVELTAGGELSRKLIGAIQ